MLTNKLFMEQRRKKQLAEHVDKAYKRWVKNIDREATVDNIEETVKMISDELAFGTIITTGKKNPSSYIGTYKQCQNLKKSFGGQIGVISNVWYWAGIAYTEDISKIVANKKKNLVISVPVNDFEEAILCFGETASLDIRYGCFENGRISYIGGYKICILLRKTFGGKIGKINNHWHWIGYANFKKMTYIYQNYQRNTKRYKRKKVVVSL